MKYAVYAVSPAFPRFPRLSRTYWQKKMNHLDVAKSVLRRIRRAAPTQAPPQFSADEPSCDLPDDSALIPLGPDGWPLDCIDPDDLDPCPKCGTLELWQTLFGNWRCLRCDPPIKAQRLRALAAQIRRRTKTQARYFTK